MSAVVADGLTGRRHRSNCELVAQGVANIASAAFGGICATGTIARTATNVRAGARGPVAGMLHSVFILLFMLVAAPLASYIPLAALAGVLAVVAWNMAEKHEFGVLLRSSWGDAVVLMATFLLTVFRDLTEGILVGLALGALLFIHRMAETSGVEVHVPLVPEDKADTNGELRPYDPSVAADPEVVVYRITGAFFFGAASAVASVLDDISDRHKALVIDFSAVPFIDSTAANTIAGVARKTARHGVALLISGASPAVRRSLLTHGVRPPEVVFEPRLDDAIRLAHQPRQSSRRLALSPLARALPAPKYDAIVADDPTTGGFRTMLFRRSASRAVAAVLALLLCVAPAAAQENKLTIFAAASLKNALDEVNAAWTASTGKAATISYAASSALAKQIEAGAPADIFISADLDWMDYVEKKEARPRGYKVEPARQSHRAHRAEGLAVSLTLAPGVDLAAALNGGLLSMGNTDSVPAGKYGKAALEKLGAWDGVKDKIAQAENVRAALLLVVARRSAARRRLQDRRGLRPLGPRGRHLPAGHPSADRLSCRHIVRVGQSGQRGLSHNSCGRRRLLPPSRNRVLRFSTEWSGSHLRRLSGRPFCSA